jgi:hypothetical protein
MITEEKLAAERQQRIGAMLVRTRGTLTLYCHGWRTEYRAALLINGKSPVVGVGSSLDEALDKILEKAP